MSRLHAWRAALRLARRDAWRNKGRSALVAIMIALPVLACATVSVVYRSDERDPRDQVRVQLGTGAQAAISTNTGAAPIEQRPDGGDYVTLPDNGQKSLSTRQFDALVRSTVSPRDRIITDTHVYGGRDFRFGDRLLAADVREFDYTQVGFARILDQVAGRAPAGPGEVVVSRHLAEDKGVTAGARLTYEPTRKQLTVVGVVDGYDLDGWSQVIALPGALLPAGQEQVNGERRWLVAGPDPVTWDQVVDLNQRNGLVLSRAVVADPPPRSRVPYFQENSSGNLNAGVVAVAVVVVGLALLQIGLLAGPAIAVGARRNQRGLAIMASNGAQRRDLRAVVLATNGVIGLVASAVAAVLGAGLGTVIVLAAQRWYDAGIVRVDIHPLDLLVFVLTGAITAVGAALVPARQAARLDVVAALTGRRGQAPPRHRVPVAGLLVAAAGLGLAVWGASSGSPFVCVAGMALTELGLVVAVGGIVALVARGAVRLPFAARFALRDAARQRSRTAPAVAAVMAAVAGGTCALVYVASQAHYEEQTYRPASARGVVQLSAGDLTSDEYTAAESTLRSELPLGSVATLRSLPGADSTWVGTSLVRAPASRCPEGDGEVFHDGSASSSPSLPDDLPAPATPRSQSVIAADPRCHHREADFAGPAVSGWFDDGSALQIVTGQQVPADVAALRAGSVLVFDRLDLWPDGTVHVVVTKDASDNHTEKTVVLPGRLSRSAHTLDNPVFPPSTAKRLGYMATVQGLVATTTRPVSGAEEDKAQAALTDAVDSEFSIERGYQNDYGLGLLALVAAAAVVTLAGTFTAVGLAAAEGRADLATLAAVGAAPAVRRRLAAAQAGVISGLGVVLGLGSGILAGWLLVLVNRYSLTISTPDGGVEQGHWVLLLPWPYLLALGLGVPLLAVAVGFTAVRSKLPLVRRLGQ